MSRKPPCPPAKRPPARPAPGPALPPDAAFAQAIQLHRTGRLDEAAALYRKLVRAWPTHAGAWQLLGVIALQRGDHAAAAALIRHAVALAPDYAEAHTNLGAALQALGRLAEAAASHRHAVRLRPDYAMGHFNLGTANRALGRPFRALHNFGRAIALAPDHAEAHGNHGAVLHLLGRHDEALDGLRRALALRPDYAEAHSNLGAVLEALGRLDAAEESYRQALALRPDFADAAYNLGNVLWRQDFLAPAQACFERAVALDPAAAAAHWNLGLVLLRGGDLARGWAEYDWRLASPAIQARRHIPLPAWQGEDLTGKRILVWREQGLGDELMFGSCYADLIAGAGHVIIECDPRLTALFARSFPTATVRAQPADAQPADAELQVAAGSLPRWLRPARAAFPQHAAGYLKADPAAVAVWRTRLAALGGAPRIGLCWRSRLMTAGRSEAYAGLERWAAVFAVPGLVFVNLQYDRCEEEIRAAERRFGIRIARWPDLDLMNDLDGAAALTAALDLVITAPTSVGEMAGALGVPTWRFTGLPDWTALGGGDRPWFPSMRLFQPGAGRTVDDTLHAVAEALNAFSAAQG